MINTSFKKIRMNTILFSLAVLASFSGYAQDNVYPAPAAKGVVLLKGGTVHVGNGQVIENATVKINNGKIEQVGQNINATGDAKVIDATGVQALTIPITPMVEPLFERFPEMSAVRRGNIMARTRMVALFDQSAAFGALVDRLEWKRRASADPADRAFWDGHANAMICGPGGLEAREDLWIGATVMAPGVTYADHDHPPEEVYLSLTPGEWWNADMDWTDPGARGVIHNPPGIRHAMRSGAGPFLALWFLPV